MLHSFLRRVAAPLLLLSVLFPGVSIGATAATLAGRVTSADGSPATGVRVSLTELRRSTVTDGEGGYRFEAVPPGAYLLEAEHPRLGGAVLRVAVVGEVETRADLALDLFVHQDEIVVTASPDVRSRYELAQPTSVMDKDELALHLQPTLGETLSRQPGVTSTFFGAGASRPVIRGLGGDRIRVLEGGIGTGDASTTSPDHAVSVDPIVAERIEVLRGPATLLYGSSAVGGVVNVIDNRIPESVPEETIGGTVEARGGSVSDERSASASFDGGAGRLAWHLDVLKRRTDDYRIPGFAESSALRESEEQEGEAHEEEEVQGLLPNSATEAEGGALGLSYIGDSAFFGVSASGLDSLYGIPGGHEHEHEGEPGEEEEEDGGVRIDLRQRRWDLRGGTTRPFGIFRGANLRFGVADYEHRELEGDAIGTVFTNESREGRFELLQRRIGPLSGSMGVQVQSRDFAAVGDEAFVPPTETRSWAGFVFQELVRGDWRFQAGGRFESQDVTAILPEETAEASAVRDRSFQGVSGSLGAVWQPSVGGAAGWSAGLSLSRSTKLPNAEELFSNGPHLATNAFEIGDPSLGAEKSLSLDLTVRRTAGRVSGEVTVFANRFDGFIFEQATAQEEDGLQVFRFTQRDAEFRGAELEGIVQLFHGDPHHLDLEAGADFVRAELTGIGGSGGRGEPLPRIPAERYRLGLHYRNERLTARIDGQRVGRQDRVSALETPTDGYTTLDASLGYRFFAPRAVFDVILKGTNLTDEEARNHVSFLKDLVPMPGRDVSLAVRTTF